MTLPVSGEQHEKAIEAALDSIYAKVNDEQRQDMADALATYFASLAAQGVWLVDRGEVAEWLRGCGLYVNQDGYALRQATAEAFLARFGGG